MLTLGDAVLLVVGNVIGVGIFTTTGIVAKYAGSALGTIIPWILYYPVILFLISYTLIATGVLLKSPKESILGLFITLTGVPFYLLWKKGKEERAHEV